MKRLLLIGLLMQAFTLGACGDEPTVEPEPDASDGTGDHDKDGDKDKDNDEPDPPSACDGVIPVVETITPRDDGQPTNLALCPVEGGVRHLRVEGVSAPPAHTSYQIYLGLEDAIGSQDEVPEGALRLMAYGGGLPAPPASFTIRFGGESVTVMDTLSFINEGRTWCADVFDGNEARSPAVVLWVDGYRSADCLERSTLTLGSAFAVVGSIGETKGAIAFEKDTYVYLAAGLEKSPTITLDNEPVLSEDEVSACSASLPASLTIERAAEGSTSRFLCPVPGGIRHVRFENVITPPNHAAVQFYIGASEIPETHTDAPPEGALRLMAYGGSSPHLRPQFGAYFGSASHLVPNADFLTEGETFCLDIFDGDDDVGPRLILWVNGHEEADCLEPSTLTLESAHTILDALETDRGAVTFDQMNFIYLNSSVGADPIVTIDNRTVLDAGALGPISED